MPAGEYLRPLLKANPGVAEIRQIMAHWQLQAGLSAVTNKDHAKAVAHFRAGLALQPEEPGLNANLGVQLLVLQRPAEAVPTLENYQRLQPGNPQASLFLGQAYVQTGRIADARRVLTTALQQAEQAGNSATARHCREILVLLPP